MRPTGRRALLNLGHTFGHALEAEAGYAELLHGEAVALGCVLALRFSAARGLCPTADVARLEALLVSAGLPTRLPGGRFAAPALLARMAQDKKNTDGLTLVLARGIGQAFLAPGVDPAEVREFLISQGAPP
jgi:3-dehydroquinate synthase